MLDAVRVARHHDLEELRRLIERILLVDVDRVDVAGEDVADGSRDHIAFAVDLHRRRPFLHPVGEHLPEPDQIGQVVLQFLPCFGRWRPCE